MSSGSKAIIWERERGSSAEKEAENPFHSTYSYFRIDRVWEGKGGIKYWIDRL